MRRKLALVLGMLAIALSAFAFSADKQQNRADCPLRGTPLCPVYPRHAAISSSGRLKIQRPGSPSRPFSFEFARIHFSNPAITVISEVGNLQT